MDRWPAREKAVSEEKLLAFIREKAEMECQSLLEEAERESERILASANQEAQHIHQKGTRELKQRGEAEQRLTQNRAKLVADRILAEAKGHALEEAKAFLLDEVETWVDRPLYENAMKEFLLAAAEAVGQDPSVTVQIFVSSKDKRRIQGLLKKYSIAYELEIDDSLQGGLLMQSADGRWLADATIHTRLEKVWEESLPELSKLLFEERPEEEEEEEQGQEETSKAVTDEQSEEETSGDSPADKSQAE